MKLLEAIEKRVPGCKIKIDLMPEIKITVDQNNNWRSNFMIKNSDFDRDDWVIEYPVPRILTAGEYMQSRYGALRYPSGINAFNSLEMTDAFNTGLENGYLKHQLECKELFDVIEILYNKADHDGVSIYTQKIFDEYDKLIKGTK